jgi:hypothetical protein
MEEAQLLDELTAKDEKIEQLGEQLLQLETQYRE